MGVCFLRHSCPAAQSVDETSEGSEEEVTNRTTQSDGCGRLCGGGEEFTLRQLLGLLLGALVLLGFVLSETSSSLTPKQHRTLGVLGVAIVSWITEVVPIPITGLLIGPLLVLWDACSIQDALGPYVSNITLVLFGSNFIALGMERHGLDRRFAQAISFSPVVRTAQWRLRLAMMVGGCAMSMWISNTATASIMTPIVLRSMGAEPYQRLADDSAQRTLTGSLLSVAYSCNAGGMGTLVGTPSNLVAARLLGEEGIDLGFVHWLCIGLPSSVMVVSLCYGVLYFLYRPATASLAANEDSESSRRGQWSRGEKVVFGSFCSRFVFGSCPLFTSLPVDQAMDPWRRDSPQELLSFSALYQCFLSVRHRSSEFCHGQSPSERIGES
eukprot:TRINITY_DN44124_c0_g1_i1.p1 TRINITY_DN44124_c0_g1~~TRINITY_DN44124_c0_g1_i1.p1  ORF type:complete len:383 (-),score=46.82 TRINITY_DN44124_c0_g1_i1:580-1728(-)